MELHAREAGGSTHAAFMAAGPRAFMTEPVLVEIFRHVGCASRPLSDDLRRQLASVGGVIYVEWLLGQLLKVSRLPADDTAILEGVLSGKTHEQIAYESCHERKWVGDRIRRRLVPRLVPLINAALSLPEFRYQAMLCQQVLSARDTKKKG